MHHRIRRLAAATAIATLALGIAGCGTIMQGSMQEVAIGSTPSGARVLVNGAEAGTTPYVAKLRRKNKHMVRIELDGYQPYELALTRSTSGWVWGNIVFGGLIGLVVDASTGGMYKLKPEQIQATLAQSQASISSGDNAIVVAVVLRPDPTWERVGSLQAE